jgi:hypothetical protein
MITGLTPIYIKLEETAQYYNLIKVGRNDEMTIDKDTTIKYWLHPAVTLDIITDINDNNSKIQIFTEGSKSEQGVGAGIAIYTTDRIFFKLDSTLLTEGGILRNM